MIRKIWIHITTLTLLILPLSAMANESSTRTKVLDFEDELVEGMNKQPLDSLNQIRDQDRDGDSSHLYTKRKNFDLELNRSLRQMGRIQ